MAEVSTSILGVEKEGSVKVFYDLEVAGTDFYHIDIMDGKFVEQNTEEKMLLFTNEIKHISNIPLDIHLMVENIKENINRYLAFEPDIITFHLEACKDKEEVMQYIKLLQDNKVKCGISIKPQTKIEEIFEFLPYMYLCLIMTVEPGKGGQQLIPETVEKVRQLKDYLTSNKLDTFIEVDGGIKADNAYIVKSAGADILVSGSGILKAENYKETILDLKK